MWWSEKVYTPAVEMNSLSVKHKLCFTLIKINSGSSDTFGGGIPVHRQNSLQFICTSVACPLCFSAKNGF